MSRKKRKLDTPRLTPSPPSPPAANRFALSQMFGWMRPGRRVLAYLAASYAILVATPPVPAPTGNSLDSSWIIGLNLAHWQGLTPGKQVIFTLGPLGYLFYPVAGYAERWPVLIMWTTLWALVGFALVQLVRALEYSAASLCVLAAFIASFALGLGGPFDYLEVVIISLGVSLMVQRALPPVPALCLLGILSGFAALAKLNEGALGFGVYYAYLLFTIVRNRTALKRQRGIWLLLSCLPVLSLSGWYLAVTGSLLSLPAYLRNSMEIGGGYSGAMGLDGPGWQVGLALATMAGLFVAIPLVADDARAFLPGLLPAAVCSFLFFKHAMVRQDSHAWGFDAKMISASLFFMVLATTRRDRLLIAIFQVGCVLATALELGAVAPAWLQTPQVRLDLSLPRAYLTGFLNWNATWKRLEEASRTGMAPAVLPARYKAVVGNGTVEAVSWSIDAIAASGLNWRPRPVIQTYAAYTPRLDLLNAAHVDSSRGADYCVLTWGSVDGRHPFFDDPASWRQTLNWYDITLVESTRSLMSRRKVPRYGDAVPFASSSAAWGRPVRVPDARGMLVVNADLTQSLAGKLRQILFRETEVFLEVKYRSGNRLLYRTVPANLTNGFIIDPFPSTLAELSDLMRPPGNTADRVESFTLSTPDPSEFRDAIPIRWSRLPFRGDDDAVIGAADRIRLASLQPLWNPRQSLPLVRSATAVVRNGSLTVRPLNDDPQMEFGLGTPLGHFKSIVIRARFGVADRIDAFFGREVDERGIMGQVPAAHKWFDVVLNLDMNPYWAAEAGSGFRFDPASALGVGSEVEIAGIWGSEASVPAGSPAIGFYPLPDAGEQKPAGPRADGKTLPTHHHRAGTGLSPVVPSEEIRSVTVPSYTKLPL